MEKNNPLKIKSYQFALHTLGIYKTLVAQKEFILSRQLIRSATSIGANIEEALQGQSKRDFLSKLSISLKEANEAHYWLRLLKDGGFLQKDKADDAILKVVEIIKLLTAIIKTTKKNLRGV
ncbi:MAG: four helix bundle protein [Candidatus Peribacteraceae bacterium]